MIRCRIRTIICLCILLLVLELLLFFKVQNTFPTFSYMTTRASTETSTERLNDEEHVIGLADPMQLLQSMVNAAYDITSRDLWPSDNKSLDHDYLLEQLHYLDLLENVKSKTWLRKTPLPRLCAHPKDKLIVLTAGVSVDPWEQKRAVFLREKCPITNCYLLEHVTDLPLGVTRPDAVVYRTSVSQLIKLSEGRSWEEIWIMWQLESPLYASMENVGSMQTPNWTASFRSDSTIVTPYDKYVSSSELQRYQLHHLARVMTLRQNYAFDKNKLVAWFVSNCESRNNRLKYVNELKQFIQVDIFGGCGPLQCVKSDPACTGMLKRDYKFYLALENSNCRQYITEKLYQNAFSNDVVPVVMGAHPDDYRAVAPPHSYIHVDDFESPRHLADYLKLLDKNDTLYNEYFKWKGTGSFINTKFWCRLCAMLHARDQTNYVHTYTSLAKWWRTDQCVMPEGPYGATWRNISARKP